MIIFVEEPDVFPCRRCNTSGTLIAGKEAAVSGTAVLIPLPPEETGEHGFVFPQTRLVDGTAH